MCTVSWARSAGEFHLLMNRDERLTRGAEAAPTPATDGGVQILAPRDTDFGGTWISVNEFGVAACLLNGYRAGDDDGRDFESRGHLVAALGSSESVAEALRRLNGINVARYRTFVLALLEPDTPTVVVKWDGNARSTRQNADGLSPLVSSSFRPEEVRARRRAAFEALGEGPASADALEKYHRSHAGGQGPYSPCMHRDDAATRSLSRIGVGPGEVSFVYTPGPPCSTAPLPPLTIARAARQTTSR